MLIDPPADKLVEIVGCKYALTTGVSKRVRVMMSQEREMIQESGLSAITLAAKEVESGETVIVFDKTNKK